MQQFNCVDDEAEVNNLAEDPAMSGTLAPLYEELLGLRGNWNDLDSTWGKRFWNRFEGNGGFPS